MHTRAITGVSVRPDEGSIVALRPAAACQMLRDMPSILSLRCIHAHVAGTLLLLSCMHRARHARVCAAKSCMQQPGVVSGGDWDAAQASICPAIHETLKKKKVGLRLLMGQQTSHGAMRVTSTSTIPACRTHTCTKLAVDGQCVHVRPRCTRSRSWL